jgi:2'-5' RNA ligase
MKQPLWFIALIPPDGICEEVTAFKKLAAKRYHSKRALNSPPHITLQPPFSWPEERIGEIKDLLAEFSKTVQPFRQELRNFDCFKPRVIFVDIVLHEALQDLAARLKATLTPLLGEDQVDTRPYHPHMTVAFKDLKPYWFYRAWAFFSEQAYHRSFEVKALHLLRHNGQVWEVVGSFEFFNF